MVGSDHLNTRSEQTPVRLMGADEPLYTNKYPPSTAMHVPVV